MTRLTTTLALIKNNNPCSDGLETLIAYLGKDYPEDKEINLLTILESNGIDHFFWAFRAVKSKKIAKKIAVELGIAFSERVLPISEDKYLNDFILEHREMSASLAADSSAGVVAAVDLASKLAAVARAAAMAVWVEWAAKAACAAWAAAGSELEAARKASHNERIEQIKIIKSILENNYGHSQ